MTVQSVAARIMERVEFDPFGGCWLWAGARTGEFYGTLKVNGKSVLAHRASYAENNGPIPDGLLVCHRCDNRLCVNPAHLFLGSNSENMADMRAKGRGSFGHPGEKAPRAKLSEAQVREILATYEPSPAGTHQINPNGIKGLARRFGVGHCHISDIIRGERWAHLRPPSAPVELTSASPEAVE